VDEDALRAAIRGAIGAGASLVVAFVVVLFVRFFTDDPETQILVGILTWVVAFGGFLWGSGLDEPD
jgi:Na+/melibiose symporter-like transporter